MLLGASVEPGGAKHAAGSGLSNNLIVVWVCGGFCVCLCSRSDVASKETTALGGCAGEAGLALSWRRACLHPKMWIDGLKGRRSGAGQ